MITEDPQRRTARLAELLELLKRQAVPEDRDLLLAFAPVACAETPDRVVFGLTLEALAARINDHFRFVVREMPPPTQLYRGLPGIHVAVRNPPESAWVHQGPGDGLPSEITVVEAHTLDAPFIFESLKNYFRRAGIRVFSAIHPILSARRQWERIVWVGGPHEEGSKECYCYFQIERIDGKERRRHIEHEIFSVLKCLFVSVEDFKDMLGAVGDAAKELRSRDGKPGEVESARAFIDWLLRDNYIFQGTMRYRIAADGQADPALETATGIFTDPALLPVVFPGFSERAESRVGHPPTDGRIVDIDHCHDARAIYYLEPIDDLILRHYGPDGRLAQATLVLGRFAKGAFTQKAGEIPLLKEKLEGLLAQSGALPKSYAYREMRALFNRFPTRELFYADTASLKQIIDRIVYMTGDDEIAVNVRHGRGYVSLAIAFSRLRYSYHVEHALSEALASAFGPVTFQTSADCGSVSLLLFYFDAQHLEHPVELQRAREITASLVTTWEDRVAEALEKAFGEREGRRLFERHVRSESRSGLYRESTAPEEVPEDVKRLESLESQLEVRVIERGAEHAVLKLFSPRSLALTDTIRTLTNLGLGVADDLRIPLQLPEGRKAFLFRLDIEGTPALIAALSASEDRFIDALRALDEGRASDDPLNGLILAAGLSWREVEVLRTLRNHLLQIRLHYNAETVNRVLLRNSGVAQVLFALFAARFDPALPGAREAAVAEAESQLRAALEGVKRLAEDEVLRGFANLARAALRTNFYQRPERPVFAIKVDSRKVEGMPSPRPMFEIYVHSPLLEGIHLRGGRVARGGIRWSDRHDDFRTEVLGLMKTQMVKNSIIVPVGAKGGFVLKGHVPPRPALDAYLIDRYREYVSGLLDVTDNRVDGQVVHPPAVVFYDGDDPYLVVAADKGTAHLSDTANSVSAQYGFWLGDAFASGGSAGYDHKKMGITARGAWECVEHHFENLSLDIERQPFTCAGIGDMSGDVFGNGALLSRNMKLVAAFNHAHIFVDPDPDAEKSFEERERLFRLPRSGWRDYDPSLISKGGGVFDRSAKAVALTPELKRLLELEGDSASGEEVIRRILTAPVDLLYNGGIGTYVKASAEEDADVGDRANDRVRVNGAQVRAKVVGEGGNLGFTQKGRIEYWIRGGMLNTDAADNSGGVSTSDHEVNIKILMDIIIKAGKLEKHERNEILAEMTDEVAALVLQDNERQSLALSLDSLRSAAGYEEFLDYIDDLVGAGVLNRADDAIPSREELRGSPERARGLPRPLLAVLLGHTKLFAFQMLMETDFPDGAAGRPFQFSYFPKRLRENYHEEIGRHTLRREIVATGAINALVNQAGVTFLSRVQEASRAGIGEVVAAYFEVDRGTGAPARREQILAGEGSALERQRALLELEQRIETLVRARLDGEPQPLENALAAVPEPSRP